MKLNVLISCMHQKDVSLIERSNVQTDVVVINQCDEDKIEEFDFLNKKGGICHAKFISTTERGLSRSRNMAIRNAESDICLICDDDENFETNYETDILNAFKNNKNADIIIFRLNHPTRKYKNYSYKIGYLKSGNVGSVQIAFRRSKIVEKDLKFDEMMGSGTGNGDGEENKFIMDCLNAGLKIIYLPITIATLIPTGNSQWFKGFTKEYFVNKAWVLKRIYGPFFSYILLWRFLLRKYSIYNREMSFMHACLYMHRGFVLKRK